MSESSCPCGKSDSKACPAASSSVAQNGKGDAPRNISRKFRKNYDSIRWKTGGNLKAGEKFVKVY